MKGWVIALVVVGLILYASTRYGGMYIKKNDLGLRLEARLDFVNEPDSMQVKKDLMADADKLGIYLDPSLITIIYEDTKDTTLPQRYVAKVAEFTNKHISINVKYTDRIFGIPFHQEVLRGKIKQIQARRPEPSREMKELLE